MKRMASKRDSSMSTVIATDARPSVPIYLDHNATTPLDERVLKAMMPYFTRVFGNAASRTHSFGHEAERAVDIARQQVATLINAEAKEIIWTSGATESINLAVKGLAAMMKDHGRHIITQATEHNAVLDPCRWLANSGFDLTILPVDECGLIAPQQVKEAIRSDTILVSVMWANNETGTIQPIREIGAACRERNVCFHTDATQAVGKVAVDVRAFNVDLLSFSGHKLYGPKGCGALYVRQRSPRIKLEPLLHGGGHERGFRSGTINVPGVVGVGVASELCQLEMKTDAIRISSLRDRLENELKTRLTGVRVNGDPKQRLPHTTHLTFEGIDAEGLLVAMSDVAISTGSACTSASIEPSHVLSAMGLNESMIYSSVRFGLGRGTTSTDISYVILRICETVEALRKLREVS
jgi:cysteine desulfurase